MWLKINLRSLVSSSSPTDAQPQKSPSPEPTAKPPVSAVTYVAASTPSPTPPPRQTIRNIYQDNFLLILLIVGSLPFLLWGAWLLWRYGRRRRLRFKKEAVAKRWRPDQLLVHGAADQLFRGPAFRRLAQEMRRHLLFGSHDIDPQPTVHATIRQGGWFTPVYGRRREQPEYLALIDRASFRDQQSRLEDEMLSRLVKDSILIERFYFQGDPLVCRRADPKSPHVALQDLTAAYPNHHLLIFSDGGSLIDPLTGYTQRWVETLAQWPRRALLTPEPPRQWGYREWMLSEQGFVVAPASRDGLRALIETISTGAPPKLGKQRSPQPFPGLLLERPGRWLENLEPERMELNRLCFQLRRYLGDEGYYLLAACAVYPALSWDLTVYLGHKLAAMRDDDAPAGSGDQRDAPAPLEELLPLLVRLPWFRHGTMPDWLRLRLLAALLPEHETRVRRALRELLLTALAPEQHDLFPLQYTRRDPSPPAPDKPDEAQTFWPKLRAKFRAWRRKRLFWNLIDSEPRDSQLRDYVFLDFMSRRESREQSLTINIPDALKRILTPPARLFQRLRHSLFPDGIPDMGWRLQPTFAAAVLASLICMTAAAVLLPAVMNISTVNLGNFCWYCVPTPTPVIDLAQATPTPTASPIVRATRTTRVVPPVIVATNNSIPPLPIDLMLDIYAADGKRMNERVTITLRHKTRPNEIRTFNNVDASQQIRLPVELAGPYELTVKVDETQERAVRDINVNPNIDLDEQVFFPVKFFTQLRNPTDEELRARSEGTILIRLRDAKTDKPIESGKVDVYRLNSDKPFTSRAIGVEETRIRVPSGPYEIMASVPNYDSSGVVFTLARGQTQRVTIELSPLVAQPSPTPDEEDAVVIVPNVTRTLPSDAEALIRAAGLVPVVKGDGKGDGIIIEQTPRAGTKVKRGTTVTLLRIPLPGIP